MAGIQRAGEKRRIIYDPSEFRLTVANEKGRVMFLQNGFAEYCSVPEAERGKVLARFVRNWFVEEKTIPEDFEDASHDLLPAVRERTYFSMAELMMQLEGKVQGEIPYQPLGDNLAIGLVCDLPEAMQTIGQERLDKWGVTLYEATEVARENLGKLPFTFLGPKDGEGVYMSATNDNYDASRLLLLETIRQFRVKGDPVAMVPNRDTLIVTGSDDVDGIKGMLALVKDALQKPRPMSGLALRLDGDEWVSWMPPVSHPCYDEMRVLQIQNSGQHYNQQKELLDKLNQKNGTDIFVATFTVVQDTKTEALLTYCVWSKGCLTLLPKTDTVAFIEKDKALVMVGWDRAVEIVGSLMEPMGFYPERFRVAEYPTDEQLRAMREVE
jgi:hypothetical protein